jgi:hypothetical protein
MSETCLVWVGGRTLLGTFLGETDGEIHMDDVMEIKSMYVPVPIKDELGRVVKEEIREMVTPTSIVPLENKCVKNIKVIPDLFILLGGNEELCKMHLQFRAQSSGLTVPEGGKITEPRLQVVKR